MSYTIVKSSFVRITNNNTNNKLVVSNSEWDTTLTGYPNSQSTAQTLFEKYEN